MGAAAGAAAGASAGTGAAAGAGRGAGAAGGGGAAATGGAAAGATNIFNIKRSETWVKVWWLKWRQVSEINCDPRMFLKLKGKVYTIIIGPVVLYDRMKRKEWLKENYT